MNLFPWYSQNEYYKVLRCCPQNNYQIRKAADLCKEGGIIHIWARTDEIQLYWSLQESRCFWYTEINVSFSWKK